MSDVSGLRSVLVDNSSAHGAVPEPELLPSDGTRVRNLLDGLQ